MRLAVKEQLQNDPVDLPRLSQLCEVYGCPPADRVRVWTLLLGLGCEVSAGDPYCAEQRQEHFDDLVATTRLLHPILFETPAAIGAQPESSVSAKAGAAVEVPAGTTDAPLPSKSSSSCVLTTGTQSPSKEQLPHIFEAMYRLYHPDRLQFDPWPSREAETLLARAKTFQRFGDSPVDQFWLFAGFSHRLDGIHSGKAIRYFKLVITLLQIEAQPVHAAVSRLHRASARVVADAWFSR